MWGELAVVLPLILGVLVRFAASGFLTNSLFWIAQYPSWRTGPFELNFALMGMYVALILYGAGNLVGLDGWLNRVSSARQNKILQAVLG